jgi:hypothetical protein
MIPTKLVGNNATMQPLNKKQCACPHFSDYQKLLHANFSRSEAEHYGKSTYYTMFLKEYALRTKGDSSITKLMSNYTTKPKVITSDEQKLKDLVELCVMPVAAAVDPIEVDPKNMGKSKRLHF